MNWRSGLLILGTFVLMPALAGCEKGDANSAAAATKERPGTPVVAALAVSKDVPVYLDEIGRTTARESVMVQPQITGKVTSINFVDGAMIKKGELLYTIDERPFEAQLALAEATLAENRAKLKFAQDEMARMEEIKSTGAVSKTEIDQKINAVAVAQAQVQWGEASVQQAKLNLEYCRIESPIDGRAGKRMVDPGNIVNSGGSNSGTNLLLIQSLDPIYADFTVTENELGTVRKFMADGVLKLEDPQGKLQAFVDIPGDSAKVVSALSGSVAAPATQMASSATTRPSGPREGRLTFLDNTVQDSAGTVRLRATVPNSDRYFWPGQFVRVRLVLTIKRDAVLVPLSAIQIGQQGPFVYVVKSDSTVELRPVVQGQRQDELVVLNSGVATGEQVITKGQMLLSPGAKVMVTNAPAPGAAPTSQAVAEGSR
jgi:membrane fusion protein, multidrug efflux system